MQDVGKYSLIVINTVWLYKMFDISINSMIRLKTMECKLNNGSTQLLSIHVNLPVQRTSRNIMWSYIIVPL